MMDRQPYTYSVLRYRHDPLAGELLNIGVLLHAPKNNFLGTSLRKTYGRLSKLYPDFDGAALTGDLRRIESAINRLEKAEASDLFHSEMDAEAFGKKVMDDPAGSYLWSEVRSGLTKNPQEELARLYHRFVGRFESSQISRRSDADVWRPARDKLAERQLSALFEAKTIRSVRDEVEFDHAWKNGIWHCFQPLSFDLADAASIQEKAARWVGHMVGLSSAEEQFRPYFIVGQPSQPHLAIAYERALAFLGDAPTPNAPRVVRDDDLEQFVDELESEMQVHLATD